PEAQPDGSVLWNGIILDSTRIKQANLELAAASRAKSEFLATVSHELRTPLNAIIGFSEIMLRETLGALGNDAYREYAQDIHDSGNHLLKIINEILDLTRIEAGKVELDEEVIALDPMIRSCIRLIAGRLEERALSVVYEPESPGVTLRADERKLRQILINLLSNAIKFTSDGSSVRVCTRLDPTGELVLSVSDSGTGIGADDLAKVFDPFFQAQSGLARGYEGLGLGLPLTKGLVELHKGRIEIDSELDSGTIVTVTFPAERVVT
ncbi:MAG: HAMP domain-containing histidine kinase, partial [Kiloniellales bacterium]|nr:HAMP domain-containing histidine kinase [Kiloniellales bacterium]